MLQAGATIQIARPISEVFEAIIDPDKMSNHFISESTGRMEAGKDRVWKFPEFDVEVPVSVLKVERPWLISFEWDGAPGKKLIVEIILTEKPGNATLVKITEGSMQNDEAGIKWLKGNSAGWMNFLDCLKAYQEYGINLRKGSFDFMKDMTEEL